MSQNPIEIQLVDTWRQARAAAMGLQRRYGWVLFVASGDLHIHDYQLGTGRVERGVEVLRELLAASDSAKVPLVINGDLMHNKHAIVPSVYDAIADALSENAESRPLVFLNTGNHERPSNHDLSQSTLGVFEYIPNVCVIKDVLETQTAVFLPSVHDAAAFEALLNKLPAEPTIGARVLFAHYPTTGAALGNGAILRTGRDYSVFKEERYRVVLLSDIHKHQPVGQRGYHLGAPLANNFGEAGYDCRAWFVCIAPHGTHTVLIGWKPQVEQVFCTASTPAEAESLRAQGNELVRVALPEPETPGLLKVDDRTDLLGVLSEYATLPDVQKRVAPATSDEFTQLMQQLVEEAK